MIDRDLLSKAMAEHVPAQRWFARSEHALVDLDVAKVEVLRRDWPVLAQVLVDAHLDNGAVATYQVVLGLRPMDDREAFLEGKGDAVLGELETELGRALAYDATIDPELAICLLEHVAPGEEVERARYLGADQSNTSVVFDERLILKVFRRLGEGRNPDAEVTRALAQAGFTNVAEPVAEWRGDDADYAVVNQFLVGATDGFTLALTSLRDLYDRRCEPAEAGGDFAPEARRLGTITAEMHLALARAFGTEKADPAGWAADMEAQLDRVRLDGVDADRVRAVYSALRDMPDPGPALRVHGDYHLGQVMRTDAGWFVLDFEGEPDRPLEERRRPSSPMRDVAGMARSFHYASAVALREFGEEADDELTALATQWEERNADAFVAGYLDAEGVDAVLPAQEQRDLVAMAFELDKAVYEVGYELAHRPEWAEIPLFAVQRLLEGS